MFLAYVHESADVYQIWCQSLQPFGRFSRLLHFGPPKTRQVPPSQMNPHMCAKFGANRSSHLADFPHFQFLTPQNPPNSPCVTRGKFLFCTLSFLGESACVCQIWYRSDHRRRRRYAWKDTHTDTHTHTLLYRYKYRAQYCVIWERGDCSSSSSSHCCAGQHLTPHNRTLLNDESGVNGVWHLSGSMPDYQSREPGFKIPICHRFEARAFSFSPRRPSSLSSIDEYLT